MSRSSKALRIPFVAEVADAIKSIRGLDKEIDGLDRSAREAQEAFKKAGDATDDAFDGAQDSVAAAEKAMRALGVKSEQVADNQIAHLRSSFAQLKASGAASTKEIARAYQNMQAKIARINAQIGRDGRRTFQQLANDASAQLRKIGDGMSSAGRSLTMRVTAPVTVGFGAALKVAGDFEQQMQGVRALLVGISDKDFAKLTKAARDLGKSTKFSASETAGAIEVLASQGLNAQQILGGALKATADTAAASGSTIEEAANLVTQASNVFGIETGKMGVVANRAVGLMDVSRFGVGDFGLALSQGGLAARQAKLSFEEFAATIAIAGKYFDSGSDAGTSFKTFMASLSKTSKPAQEAMQKIGFSAYDASGRIVSMSEIVRRLQQSLRNLSDEEKSQVLNDIFGSDAGRMAFALATEGVQGFGKALDAVMNGNAAKAAETRMKGFKGSFEEFKGAIEELGIAIMASGILETVTSLVKKVTEWIDKLSETSPATLKFVTYLALAAAAIGPLLLGLGQMAIGAAILVKAFAMVGVALGGISLVGLGMAAGIGLAIGAVVAAVIVYRDEIMNAIGDAIRFIGTLAGLVEAVAKHAVTQIVSIFDGFRQIGVAAVLGLIGLLGGLADILETIAKHAVTSVVGAFQGLLSFLAEVGSFLYDLMIRPWVDLYSGVVRIIANIKKGGYSLTQFFRDIGSTLYDFLVAPWVRAYAKAKSYFGWIISMAQKAGRLMGIGGSSSSSARGYATGGIVRGPGTGTSDSIMAWLSDGEGVIRARAVQHYGAGLINAINDMTWSPAAAMAPAVAGAGGKTAYRTPVNVSLAGESFGLYSDDDDTAARFERAARRQAARRPHRVPGVVR